VAKAFTSGTYSRSGQNFGTGQTGDLAATVAAVLLDDEARGAAPGRNAGKLREPVLKLTGVLRALNGSTDGEVFGAWGDQLHQHVFQSPSVFNFYPPDHPVAGTQLVGPAFHLHNASAALQRINYLWYLLDWGGNSPNPNVPGAIGTHVDLTGFLPDAADAGALVDRLSRLAFGQTLSSVPRDEVIKAVSWWTVATDKDTWQLNRVKTAAYLVFASPNYQIQR
jgi:hypothetical protein